MATAAHQIEAKHQQIHTLQERLQVEMTSLSSRWHGQGFLAFQHRYSKFDTEFERVKQGLDRVHGALVETWREGRDLERTDSAVVQHVTGLTNRRHLRELIEDQMQ